jgi:hypothetical protein
MRDQGLALLTLDDVRTHVKRNDQFEDAREARMLMGYVRFESAKGLDPDYLARAERCLRSYQETKNQEFLVDAANYLEREFTHSSFEGAYFQALDDIHP